jgi:hypothetical protein
VAVAFVSLSIRTGESFTAANQELLETQTACGRIAVLARGATVEEGWDSWNEARSTCLPYSKVTTVRHVQCSVASLRRKRLEVVGIIDYVDIAESLEVCSVTMG